MPRDEGVTAARRGLSKSKIAAFEQCPKRLWLGVQRAALAEGGPKANARVSAGDTVGAAARALHPGGILIEPEGGLTAALRRTHELLEAARPRPLFEATFRHEEVLVRADILEPTGEGAWRLAEVKSTVSAKEHQRRDLATQLWVARGAGVPVRRAVIRHLNSAFILKREGDYAGLFQDADVTDDIEPVVRERSGVVAAARETLSGPEPAVAPGPHCGAPVACEFSRYCTSLQPPGPEWPVTVLPHGGGRRWLELGVEDLHAVDPDALVSDVHRRVWRSSVTGEIVHDAAGAAAAMGAWPFPRTWLDFETIGFPVPRWVGTHPYQAIPFQFSADIETEGGEVARRGFLSLDGSDPRRPCADALLTLLPAAGAVVAYNASFERGRILELAELYPDLAPGLRRLAARVVDLLRVARRFWYHRDQRGSWSIKAILPTIAPELDYGDLEVGDGNAAQAAYLEAISAGVSDLRRAAIRRALEIYCARDTQAMMILARRLVG